MTDHDTTTTTPERTPTADARAGMDWWNALTEDARRQKLAYLVDLDRAPSPAQAWEIEKRDRAPALLWRLTKAPGARASCPETCTGGAVSLSAAQRSLGLVERAH